jgi:hypothetical protein
VVRRVSPAVHAPLLRPPHSQRESSPSRAPAPVSSLLAAPPARAALPASRSSCRTATCTATTRRSR